MLEAPSLCPKPEARKHRDVRLFTGEILGFVTFKCNVRQAKVRKIHIPCICPDAHEWK